MNDGTMKIAVIVCDANMAANVGGSVKTTVYTFDMPKEIADFIASKESTYVECHLAVERIAP